MPLTAEEQRKERFKQISIERLKEKFPDSSDEELAKLFDGAQNQVEQTRGSNLQDFGIKWDDSIRTFSEGKFDANAQTEAAIVEAQKHPEKVHKSVASDEEILTEPIIDTSIIDPEQYKKTFATRKMPEYDPDQKSSFEE